MWFGVLALAVLTSVAGAAYYLGNFLTEAKEKLVNIQEKKSMKKFRKF